jgi:hypothetical protein
VAARRLGQDEAYSTVREILSEVSTAADDVLWRERSDFGRFVFATLGFILEFEEFGKPFVQILLDSGVDKASS